MILALALVALWALAGPIPAVVALLAVCVAGRVSR